MPVLQMQWARDLKYSRNRMTFAQRQPKHEGSRNEMAVDEVRLYFRRPSS